MRWRAELIYKADFSAYVCRRKQKQVAPWEQHLVLP